ncbi:MAG: extracellular solute-binding protein family 1 [Glaciihabitans sp.]|nr:extracellular solute-binding protein family 1 [Glaciihabitans sp.]
MKILRTVAIGGVALLGLTACSSGASTAAESDTADLTVWVMQDSVPASAIDWLETEFASENPGSTLTVNEQVWPGIVEKLQTALASPSETPDIVEIGNTQTSTFSSVGAFTPLDDMLVDLGGDDLSVSGINSATWDGTVFAAPMYQGARILFYRQDLLKAAGIPVPTTIDELNAAAIALNAANPEGTEDFSGIYLAAADPHSLEGWLFTYGGDYAEQNDDGTWTGTLDTPESLEALQAIQDVFAEGSEYDLDSVEAVQSAPTLFNEGKVGFLSYLNFAEAQIDPALWEADKVGVMALPGLTAGEAGTPFAGGSNLAISAASPNQKLATAALEMMYSEDFQSALAAEGGWVPGNTTYSSALQGVTAEFSETAVVGSKLTPNTPTWGVADSAGVPASIWTRIAGGEDVKTIAVDVNAQLEELLND